MTKRFDTDEMFAMLENHKIATDDFISGAICMGGYNSETAEQILYYHTGWRTFESWYYDEIEGNE